MYLSTGPHTQVLPGAGRYLPARASRLTLCPRCPGCTCLVPHPRPARLQCRRHSLAVHHVDSRNYISAAVLHRTLSELTAAQ